MDTITITSKENIPLESFRSRLALHWPLLRTPPDRLAVEQSNSRVYIHHPKMNSGETDAKSLLVDYSSVELVKRVIEAIGDDQQLLIDNDFNTVLPGDQFVARLRANKEWDWRT
jgi:hypothetical protein